MEKNSLSVYSIYPERYEYLKKLGKCQKESYYQCIGLKLDQIEYKECAKKCIPNIFYDPRINFSTPFCRNDTRNEDCALKIVKKIIKFEIESNCHKSCSTLEYSGEVTLIRPYQSWKPNASSYYLYITLRYPDFMANVYEEYLICDALGMIGSVGGTLGMFIGFSMTGIISWIFGYFKKYKVSMQ